MEPGFPDTKKRKKTGKFKIFLLDFRFTDPPKKKMKKLPNPFQTRQSFASAQQDDFQSTSEDVLSPWMLSWT
jgi:hypothetical protein